MSDTLRSRLSLLALLGIVALVGVRCDGKKPSAHERYGAIAVQVQVPAIPAGAVPKAVVARGRLQVSDAVATIRDTLINVVNNRLTARLDGIPLGPKTVRIELQDAAGDLVWQSATDVTVAAEATATATLVLERVNDQAPEADFTASPEIGTATTQFVFNAEVSDVHDNAEDVEVRWDFDNDGTFETDWSRDKTVARTYGQTGNFSVTVQARDRSELVGSRTRNIRIVELVAQTGANAGRDSLQTRASANQVTLDGSASVGIDDQELVYQWSQVLDFPEAKEVSVLGTVSDNNSTTARRVFFEPLAGPGLYVFTLKVQDEATGLESPTDTLFVTVLGQPPIASVVEPGTVRLGESVPLRGTATDDGDTLIYRWRGDDIAALSDTTSATPVFTPEEARVHEFVFVAIDDNGEESEGVRLEVSVSQRNNAAPQADAGRDILVHLGDGPVQLDGSGSSDPDGDLLTYAWTQLSGPETVQLDGADTATPSFAFSNFGIYRFELEVSDSELNSAPNEVLVSVVEGSGRAVSVDGDFSGSIGLEPANLTQVGPDAQVFVTVFAGGLQEVSFYDIVLQVEPAGAFADWQFLPAVDDRFNAGDLRIVAPDFELDNNQIGVRAFSSAADAFDGDVILGVFVLRTVPEFTAEAGANLRLVNIYLGGDDENGDEYFANDLNLLTLINGGYIASDNQDPVANAGRDLEAVTGQRVILDGNGSFDPDGDPIAQYNWFQISGPASVDVADANSANPSFVPPEAGSYLFGLVVGDGQGGTSDEARVRVNVTDESGNVNQAPVAVVAQPGVAVVGQVVRLNGTGSFDPDGDDALLGYDWFVISGPTTVTLNDPTAPQPVFVPEAAGVYVFSLVVSDAELGSEPVQVAVEVNEGSGNEPPVANAGEDRSVEAGTRVTLNGRDSFDPEGESITYQWFAPEGIQLEFPRTPIPIFNAEVEGVFSFVLVVTDRDGFESAPDEVVITVGALVNEPPVADAGEDQTVELGSRVNLNGRDSFDPDGDSYSFQWFFPENVDLQFPTAGIPFFEATEIGTFGFTLVVTDEHGAESAPDQVIIEVVEALEPVLVADAGPDREVQVGQEVVLNGSNSRNADGTTEGLRYFWYQEEGPHEAEINGDQTAFPSFVLLEPGDFVFSFQVADADDNFSELDTVVVTAVGLPSEELIADAGDFQEVPAGGTVRLDGSGTRGGVGQRYYFWYLDDGPAAVDIAAPEREIIEVILPEPGEYIFILDVEDDDNNTSADTLIVEATIASQRPEAEAGSNIEAQVGDTVTLNGEESFDPDGGELESFLWAIISAPATIELRDADTAFPSFEPPAPGEYIFELVVVDDEGEQSEPSDMTVFVAPQGVPPLRLVFASNAEGDWNIYSIGLSGDSPTRLTSSPADDFDPAVSPDGNFIAFSSYRDGHFDANTGNNLSEIYLMESGGEFDGPAAQNLTINRRPQGFFVDDQGASWSPDAQRLAFSSWDFDDFGNIVQQIFALNTDGVAVNLSRSPSFDSEPAWSPAGGRIAFTSFRETDAAGNLLPSKIWSMNAVGLNQVRVSQGPGADFSPTWSPDGSRLAFVSDRVDGEFDIFIINADGTGLFNLTNSVGTNEWRPAWSPDGTLIAYISDNRGNWDLFVGNLETGQITAVVENFGSVDWPSWQVLPGPAAKGF